MFIFNLVDDFDYFLVLVTITLSKARRWKLGNRSRDLSWLSRQPGSVGTGKAVESLILLSMDR